MEADYTRCQTPGFPVFNIRSQLSATWLKRLLHETQLGSADVYFRGKMHILRVIGS